jgi:ADP-ribose pyrophosphatase
MILIDQFRYPLMDWELECPAGMPEAGESFRAAAIRELREEVGYRVGSVVEMGKYASSGGTTNEVARAFLALDCEYEAGSESPERDECIVVNRVPVERVAAFLAVRRSQGQVINPKMAALAYQFLAEGGGK